MVVIATQPQAAVADDMMISSRASSQRNLHDLRRSVSSGSLNLAVHTSLSRSSSSSSLSSVIDSPLGAWTSQAASAIGRSNSASSLPSFATMEVGAPNFAGNGKPISEPASPRLSIRHGSGLHSQDLCRGRRASMHTPSTMDIDGPPIVPALPHAIPATYAELTHGHSSQPRKNAPSRAAAEVEGDTMAMACEEDEAPIDMATLFSNLVVARHIFAFLDAHSLATLYHSTLYLKQIMDCCLPRRLMSSLQDMGVLLALRTPKPVFDNLCPHILQHSLSFVLDVGGRTVTLGERPDSLCHGQFCGSPLLAAVSDALPLPPDNAFRAQGLGSSLPPSFFCSSCNERQARFVSTLDDDCRLCGVCMSVANGTDHSGAMSRHSSGFTMTSPPSALAPAAAARTSATANYVPLICSLCRRDSAPFRSAHCERRYCRTCLSNMPLAKIAYFFQPRQSNVSFSRRSSLEKGRVLGTSHSLARQQEQEQKQSNHYHQQQQQQEDNKDDNQAPAPAHRPDGENLNRQLQQAESGICFHPVSKQMLLTPSMPDFATEQTQAKRKSARHFMTPLSSLGNVGPVASCEGDFDRTRFWLQHNQALDQHRTLLVSTFEFVGGRPRMQRLCLPLPPSFAC